MLRKLLEAVISNGGRYETRDYVYNLEADIGGKSYHGTVYHCYLIIRQLKSLDGSKTRYWLGKSDDTITLITIY